MKTKPTNYCTCRAVPDFLQSEAPLVPGVVYPYVVDRGRIRLFLAPNEYWEFPETDFEKYFEKNKAEI